MTFLWTRHHKPFVVVMAVVVGFAGIVGLNVFADNQIDTFTEQNIDALRLIDRWEGLEYATQEILLSDQLDTSLSALSESFAAFDEIFNKFLISPFIVQLRMRDTLFAKEIKTADSSWQILRPHLLNIQLRLQMLHDEQEAKGVSPHRRILIDLGYQMRDTDSMSRYGELAELVADIDYIVDKSHTHFVAMLSSALGHLSHDVESKSRQRRLVSVFLSVIVAMSTIVFLLRTYRALAESKNRYRSLQANIPVGLFRSGVDGTVLHANAAMAEIFGYSSPRAMIGEKTVGGYVDPHDRENFVSRLMADDAATNHEMKMVRRDGSSIWVACSARRFVDKPGEPAYFDGIMEDITDRKQAEQRLSEATRELEQVLELCPAVIYRCGPGPDFATTFISQNIQSHLGAAPQAFYDDASFWSNRIHPEDREYFLAGMHRVAEGETIAIEYRLMTGHGDVVWAIDEMRPLLDDSGQVIGLVGSWLDITDHKRAAEALRKSEELNKAIIDNSPMGIAVRNRNGQLLRYNSAWARIWQLGANTIRMQMVLRGDASALDEVYDYLPEWRERIKTVFHSGGQLLVPAFERRRHNGRNRWLSQLFYGLKNGTGEVERVVILTDDITERVQAQQALQESEERFRTAFETSPDSISITRLEDGICSDVNQGFVDLTGYSREESIGATALFLGIWADEQDRRELVDILKDCGHVDNIETRFRHKSGFLHTVLISARVVSIDGQPCIIALSRNIEERKRAEIALRESEERFRAVFETAEDAIFIKNNRLEYTAINPSMENLMGLPAQDIIGTTSRDIFGDDNQPDDNDTDICVLNGEIVNEQRARSFKGMLRSFHVIKVPMRDVTGNIVGLCGIARDITETERLRELALRAQRLETAGRIAGQVAHDFNNLLGPLVAYPGFIRDELPLDHPALEYVDDMERAAEQIAQINQQLLTLGRRGHYTQAPLNLNTLVRQARDQIAPHACEVEIATRLADDLMSVKGGAAQLMRVISNLMHNALDAIPSKGQLLLKTENYYVDSMDGRFGRVPTGEYVKLTIADTGCGISSQTLPKIFDPFFTTKATEKKRGSGLGLSVVHAVIEDHGGYIDLVSTPGRGTSIYVYLPVTRETIDDDATDNIVGGAETILIVDDDRLQRDVNRRLLEKLGYTVHTAPSGETALAFLQKTPCDIMLVDMLMPNGWDGTETYRRVIEIFPDQKAIIISGYSESARVDEALRMGAHAYVRKPLTLRAVATAVREALDASQRLTTPSRRT